MLHVRNEAVAVDHITASFMLHNFLILNGEQLWLVSFRIYFATMLKELPKHAFLIVLL